MSPAPAAPSEYAVAQGEPEEPLIDDEDVQGNGLAGFNKDYQAFLYFEIIDVAAARRWLAALAAGISTLRDVANFNRRFRDARGDALDDPPDLVATWTNIAFTASGLEQLTGPKEVRTFADPAFRQGLASRAPLIGDIAAVERPWVVGGLADALHGVLIVASDDRDALGVRIREIQQQLSGIRLTFSDFGEARRDRRGHEHFGFRDGISQPAVRGRLASSPAEYFSPRYLRAGPAGALFASAGKPLVWPGQFLMGYVSQAQDNPLGFVGPRELGPAWSRNGSYLVIRRLEQDVVGFWNFLRKEATAHGVAPDRIGAMLIGRWPSGCPVQRSPNADNPGLGGAWGDNNHFAYAHDLAPAVLAGPGWGVPVAAVPADPLGASCPHAAHIRKMNPRDVEVRGAPAASNLLRMMLRRGIPYGPPIPDPFAPSARELAQKRGLIFAAYMTSIVSQFEFVMHGWANSPLLPEGGGRDPILSHDMISVPALPQGQIRVPALNTWVTPTGGGYFFAPSLTAIRTVLSR